MMRFGKVLAWAPVLTLVFATASCSNDETAPEGHTSPVAAQLVVDGVVMAQHETLTLAAGQTVEVEVQFLDDHGNEITGIEEEHFAKLSFTSSTLATTTDVPDHHFRKNVTAQATAGTGTVSVGYGHDDAADETTFGPFNVSVTVPCPGLAGLRLASISYSCSRRAA